MPCFLSSILNAYECAQKHVALGTCHYLLGEKSDKEYLHTSDLKDGMRIEQPCACRLNIDICIYNGKACALFEEKQMRNPVVKLVVPQACNIGGEHVHDVNG